MFLLLESMSNTITESNQRDQYRCLLCFVYFFKEKMYRTEKGTYIESLTLPYVIIIIEIIVNNILTDKNVYKIQVYMFKLLNKCNNQS